MSKSIDLEFAAIDGRTAMGLVALKVADLDRSLRFYRDVLGFTVIDHGESSATLGTVDGQPLLRLLQLYDPIARPPRSTGLYHVAILVPSRADLGRLLARVAAGTGIKLGQSDHLVSEALYLSDPDGNGLELYRDRPRDQWRWRDGQVAMAVDPLDLQSLMAEGRGGEWTGMPAGTTIGHVHLNVGYLDTAEAFYHGVLGFDVVAKLPGALFVSAGGYHHHLGLNVWESPGGAPAPENAVGLNQFTIALPDAEALDAVRKRLESSAVPVVEVAGALEVLDPWRNRIRLAIA